MANSSNSDANDDPTIDSAGVEAEAAPEAIGIMNSLSSLSLDQPILSLSSIASFGSSSNIGTITEEEGFTTSTTTSVVQDHDHAGQLRLTITESEASTVCGEEGDAEVVEPAVEAIILEAQQSLSFAEQQQQSPGSEAEISVQAASVNRSSDSDSSSAVGENNMNMAGHAVVTPLKEDDTALPTSPGESSQRSSSSMASSFDKGANVSNDSVDDADKSERERVSPDSVMTLPRSPGEQSEVSRGNASATSGQSSPLSTRDDNNNNGVGVIIASSSSTSGSSSSHANEIVPINDIDNNISNSSSSSSSLLMDILKVASSREQQQELCNESSVILSDAGVSTCASTAPVINLTMMSGGGFGEDDDDYEGASEEKLAALGEFAKAAAEQGNGQQHQQLDSPLAPALAALANAATSSINLDDIARKDSNESSFYTARDGSGSKSVSVSKSRSESMDDTTGSNGGIKTTISSGSDSPLKEIEASADGKKSGRLLGRVSPIKVPDLGSGSLGEQRRSRSDSNASASSSKSKRSSSPKKIKSPLPMSPSSPYSSNNGGGYDKKRLSERLKQRLAKRNQLHGSSLPLSNRTGAEGSSNSSLSGVPPSPQMSPLSKPVRDRPRDGMQRETRLQAASRQKRQSKSRAKPRSNSDVTDGSAATDSDILSKHSKSSETSPGAADQGKIIHPDTVTFSDGEEENELPPEPGTLSPLNSSTHSHLRVNTKMGGNNTNNSRNTRRSNYRKCVSEVGASLSQSTRAARSKLSKHHHSNHNHHHHHHGIGILQADGIVYDDGLLLRLARQARYGRGRGDVSAHVVSEEGVSPVNNGMDRRMNGVKIHVYDLLTKDALVEMPYFNCNFPIGQCFKVVNDGCHVLGTGAYHVGVEVNGVEYAFGANNIIGMSGIFTCVPKESPGYEFRETLDFGKQHTTKRTWIRIPKQGSGTSFKTISAALGESVDYDDRHAENSRPSTTTNASSREMKHLYSFREIESFADGHAVIHSMAREYMGTDYDLLRKNCCTFARDVCIRLGVKEEDIPSWFHNAAKAGADAEDAITNVELSVRNMLDCAEGVDPLDMECYNHGFEVIPEWSGGNETPKYRGCGTKLMVVESPSMRMPRERRPLSDGDMDLSDMHETASWTY